MCLLRMKGRNLPVMKGLGESLTRCRFCIDNGIMIAHAGLLAYKTGFRTPIEEATCTQRFRTDQVHVKWRD